MSTVVAITFGRKYNVEPHPHLPGLNADHYLLVEGETRADAVAKAFELTKGEHAFDYLYSVDGVLDPAFQEQIQKWGYTEFVLQPAETDVAS